MFGNYGSVFRNRESVFKIEDLGLKIWFSGFGATVKGPRRVKCFNTQCLMCNIQRAILNVRCLGLRL
jgi:hypothetical protein